MVLSAADIEHIAAVLADMPPLEEGNLGFGVHNPSPTVEYHRTRVTIEGGNVRRLFVNRGDEKLSDAMLGVEAKCQVEYLQSMTDMYWYVRGGQPCAEIVMRDW